MPTTLSHFEQYDPQPQGSGCEKRFLCPFCGDSKPRNTAHRSMAVNIETGLYNCHRCHTKGKFKDFWEDDKASKRSQTTRAIKKAFTLDVVDQSTLNQYDWRPFVDNAKALPNTPGAKYLERRGIPCEALPNIARDCCLYHPRYFYDRRPSVLFMFSDRVGEPVAVSARFIDGNANGHRTLGPKKLGAFYTMPEVWSAPVMVIVEAPIDALTLMVCGVPAIALGGCEAPEWLAVACGLKHVIFALDNDEAGNKAAERIAPELQALGAKTARLTPQGAKDWNAMLQQSDIGTLSKWLNIRLRHIAYFDFGMKATVCPSDWWPFARLSKDIGI